jgi:prepilin-type N-terminal cleavage/methylation domain-containing protein
MGGDTPEGTPASGCRTATAEQVAGLRRQGQCADRGFAMTEVIVAILLITIVLTAVTTFFVSTTSTVRRQGGAQTAVQLAAEALDKVRMLEPVSLVTGRDQQSVNAQWSAPVAGADLADTQKVYDAAASAGAGASAALPTTAQSVVVDGVTYQRHWYLGKCWQPKGTGDCTASATYAEMYRIVVAVTWPDSTCPGHRCAYLVATLISSKFPDPLFNVNGP